ncbi:hypothetical protein Tco_1299934, partial [Tanacetum coccineum]
WWYAAGGGGDDENKDGGEVVVQMVMLVVAWWLAAVEVTWWRRLWVDSGDDYGGDGVRRLQMVATWRLRRWGSEGNGVEVAEREIKVTRWRLVGWPEMGDEVEMIDDDDDGGSGVEWWLPPAGGRNLAWILPEKGDGVGKPKGGRRCMCVARRVPHGGRGLAKWSLLVSAHDEYFRKRGCIRSHGWRQLVSTNTLWAKDMDLRSLSGWADELDLVLNQSGDLVGQGSALIACLWIRTLFRRRPTEAISRDIPSLELGISNKTRWFCCCIFATTFNAGDDDMARHVVDPDELWIRKLSCGNDMFRPGNMNVIDGICFVIGTV